MRYFFIIMFFTDPRFFNLLSRVTLWKISLEILSRADKVIFLRNSNGQLTFLYEVLAREKTYAKKHKYLKKKKGTISSFFHLKKSGHERMGEVLCIGSGYGHRLLDFLWLRARLYDHHIGHFRAEKNPQRAG